MQERFLNMSIKAKIDSLVMNRSLIAYKNIDLSSLMPGGKLVQIHKHHIDS